MCYGPEGNATQLHHKLAFLFKQGSINMPKCEPLTSQAQEVADGNCTSMPYNVGTLRTQWGGAQ